MKNYRTFGKRVAWMLLGGFALLQVYVAIRLYWVTSCMIPTYSMSPTLVAGDYIIASLQIPGRRIVKKDPARPGHYRVERKRGIRPIRAGDVVVFNYPYARSEEQMQLTWDMYFCKRCVAVPGEIYHWYDKGRTDSMYLPREGESVAIDILNLRHYRRCIEYETGKWPRVIDGRVMHADTVMHSYRFRANYYFMQGDNYNDSYDSRAWGIVPEDFILGVGLFTWFSKEPETGKIRWERMFKRI